MLLEADWEPRADAQLSRAEERTRKVGRANAAWRYPRVRAIQAADPTPGAGEVVVEVGVCGICGSDTHCIETDEAGYMLFSGPARLPVIIGHEYAGRVVEVGKDVRTLRPGQLVAAEGMLYCRVCEACRRGSFNQCPYLEMTGFSAPGAYAEYVTIQEQHLWSLDGLAERLGSERQALELGALIEPLSCSFNGIWVVGGGVRPGSNVAVYGCGPIGLGAILLCRAAGAASVLAFDIVEDRLALARACGADAAFDPRLHDPAEVILERTNGWGADVQIEAAGAAAETMISIERAFAPGGLMVYLGRAGGSTTVGFDALVSGAFRVVGSRGHAGGGSYPNLIRMLEAGVLDPTPMITGRLPMAQALKALERSKSRTDGKILLQGSLPS